jgi:putative membrane protein
MSFLRYISWLLRALLFVVLLLFALKNTMPVRLHFFLDTGWDVPLVVLLLVFFAFGMVLGIAGCLVRVVQQRREIAALKRALGRSDSAVADKRAGSTLPAPPVPPELGL